MNRSDYNDFVCEQIKATVFQQQWWLDATAGTEGWDFVCTRKSGKIQSVFPYLFDNKFIYKVSGMPRFTQTLGPVFRDRLYEGSRNSDVRAELSELIELLPKFDYFSQKLPYLIECWLPFYWRGYKQTTRYTYTIDLRKSLDDIYAQFNNAVKRNIKKASMKYSLSVEKTSNIDAFIPLLNSTYERQGKKNPVNTSKLEALYTEVKAHSAGDIYVAVDQNKKVCAALFLVWDKNSAYYLMGGAIEECRNWGGQTLLIWETIKDAHKRCLVYDFEGSMLPGVEPFFRSFGSEQKPYHFITRSNSKILSIISLFKRGS